MTSSNSLQSIEVLCIAPAHDPRHQSHFIFAVDIAAARRGYRYCFARRVCPRRDRGQSAAFGAFFPDKKYSVEITHKALAGADPDAPYTLTLLTDGKVVSQFPTEGYLMEAWWSPDGKYVAVNNHRKSDGNWLWILSLEKGNAIYAPGDHDARHAAQTISERFPEYTYDKLLHRTTWSVGWGKIRTLATFSNLHGFCIELDEFYSVNQGMLIYTMPIIKKIPYPPE